MRAIDRGIVYTGAIPLSPDFLFPQQAAMVGLGQLAEAVLGRDPAVEGLQVVPSVPAGLSVRVLPGQVYMLAALEPNPYGEMAADAGHQIVKQGIQLDPVTLPLTAPATSGYQQQFLVQCAFQERDGGQLVLPYYNAANPAQQWSGPNNSGEAQYTRRYGAVLVQVKAGAPAPAGSAVRPTPDPGWIGLAYVLVANGQTSVQSQHVTAYASAPRVPVKLPALARAAGVGVTTISAGTTLTAEQAGLVVIDTAVFSGEIQARLPPANAAGGLPLRFTFVGSRAQKPGSNPLATRARILASGTDGITNGGVTVYPMDYAVLVSDGVSRWHLVSRSPQDNVGWQTIASQSVPNGIDTAVVWGTRTQESPLTFGVGTPDTATMTAPQSVMRCRVTAGAAFAANGTGSRQMYLTWNGITHDGVARVGAAPSGVTAISFVAGSIMPMNQGDILKLWVTQDSGGPLSLTYAWVQVEVLN